REVVAPPGNARATTDGTHGVEPLRHQSSHACVVPLDQRSLPRAGNRANDSPLTTARAKSATTRRRRHRAFAAARQGMSLAKRRVYAETQYRNHWRWARRSVGRL